MEQRPIYSMRDGYAIPFDELKRLLDLFCYGNQYRVAFQFLALTGARISELKKIGLSCFYGNYVVWKAGKNQPGYRKEKLPNWFLQELFYYLKHHNHVASRIFPFDSSILRKILSSKRKQLGGPWLHMRPDPSKGAIKNSYLLQVKGIRHTLATLKFKNYAIKYGFTYALEKTANDLKHSTYKMTTRHYINEWEELGFERYEGKTMAEIIKTEPQTKITEYL